MKTFIQNLVKICQTDASKLNRIIGPINSNNSQIITVKIVTDLTTSSQLIKRSVDQIKRVAIGNFHYLTILL